MTTLQVKAAIDSLWSGYAHASDQKDAEAFGALFTEDATLDYSGAPSARGRDAIRVFLAGHYGGVDPTALRVRPDATWVSGSMAVQSGALEQDFIEQSVAKTEYGRFVLIAEQDEGGRWRIRRLTAIADSTR